MIMDEEYSREIAGYILSIFRTNPFVVMSWGINPASITIVEVGVKFHVQGFIHTGFVQVVLNEGEDLFEVTLISEDAEDITSYLSTIFFVHNHFLLLFLLISLMSLRLRA